MTVITASPTSFQQLLQLQRVSIEHLDSIRSLLQTGDPTAQLKILEKLEQLSNASAKTQAEQLEVTNTTNVINEKNVEKNVDNVKSLESKIEALKIISKESLKTQTEALKTAHEQSKISVESQVTSRESFTTLQPMGERSIKTEVEIKAELKAMRADNAKALKQQIEAITTQHNTHTDEQATIVAKTSETTEEFKSISEKLSEFKESVKGSVTGAFKGMREAPGAMIKGATQGVGASMVSSGLLKKGGITDTLFGISKREARNEFVKKQQAFDSEKSMPELQQDFVLAGKTASNIKGNAAKIEDLKKTTGLSEQDIGKLKEGRALLDEKAKLTTEYAKHDKAGQFAADSLKEGRSEAEHKNNPDPVYRPGKKKLVENTAVLTSGSSRADAPRVAAAESIESGRVAVQSEEDKNEQFAVIKEQTTLLSKIEENTRAGRPGLVMKVAAAEKKEEPSIFQKVLGGVANAIGPIGESLGKGSKGKVGSVLKKVGGAALRIAGPALAIGAADWALGAAGLLGDKPIDETKDEENWQKSSIFEKAQSGVARTVENIGEWVSPNLAKEAKATRIENESKYFEKKQADEEINKKEEDKLRDSRAGRPGGIWASITAATRSASQEPSASQILAQQKVARAQQKAGLVAPSGTGSGTLQGGQASQDLQTRPIDFGVGSTWGPDGAAGRSASQEPSASQILAQQKVARAQQKAGLVGPSGTGSGTLQGGQASQELQTRPIDFGVGSTWGPDGAPNTTSNTVDMVKPTTSSGVIVNNLSGKVDALKELAPQVANNTVIAPSNTTVNNTTNTSKIFPPTRIQDQSMDRYRYSRATY